MPNLDDYKTIVVFRKFHDDDSIIALFPAVINYPNGHCESYQHVGQHGAADYTHCVKVSDPATPAEFEPLRRELESIGYNLDIKKKFIRR